MLDCGKPPRSLTTDLSREQAPQEEIVRLAGPSALAHTLLERMLRSGPACGTGHAAACLGQRPVHQPLSLELTDYR